MGKTIKKPRLFRNIISLWILTKSGFGMIAKDDGLSRIVAVGYTRDGGCTEGFLYRGTIKNGSGQVIWLSINKHLNRDRPTVRYPNAARHDARRALLESGAIPMDGPQGNRFIVS